MLASGLAVSSVYDEYVTEQLSYQGLPARRAEWQMEYPIVAIVA